jgi:cation diffusion facilitator family transporter
MTCSTAVASPRHDELEHRAAANRAIAVSAVGLGVAGGLELLVAVLTHSVGLLGDALHNLSDVSTSALVFVGFRVSKRPSNARYPHGYDRAEDLAGLGVALVIWASAAFAGIESYRKLVGGGSTTRLGVGMLAAALAIIANQVVARYKGRVGRRIQSATLIADARHSWLDAVSSLGALVGLAGVALGARWGDPVAGLAVMLFVAHVGWEVTGDLLLHLMDGVDGEIVEAAQRAASTVADVQVISTRGRWAGRKLVVELVVLLPAATELADADHTARHVELAVLAAVPESREVTVFATASSAKLG